MNEQPAASSWEKIGEPMTYKLDREVVITAAMVREAAATFDGEVPVEGPPLDPRWLGWIERVELRGEELWGFVRWTGPRPLYGVAAAVMPARDPATGAPGPLRVVFAFPRSSEPTEAA